MRRKSARRRRLTIAFALLCIAAISLNLYVLWLRSEQESAPSTPASPDFQVAASPSTSGGRSSYSRPFKVGGDITIEDGITFKPENGSPIRLTDLIAPPRDAICLDAVGARWACGLRALLALNNIMRREEVWCQTINEVEPLQARCTVDNIDLGRLMVRQGFARPADGHDTPALVSARHERKGLWNGDWTLVGQNGMKASE